MVCFLLLTVILFLLWFSLYGKQRNFSNGFVQGLWVLDCYGCGLVHNGFPTKDILASSLVAVRMDLSLPDPDWTDNLVSDPSLRVDSPDNHFERTSHVQVQNALATTPPQPGVGNFNYPMQSTATGPPQSWQFNDNYPALPQQLPPSTATARPQPQPQPGPWNYINPAIPQQLPPPTATTGPPQPWLLNYNNPWITSMPSSTATEPPQSSQLNYNFPAIHQQLAPPVATIPPQPYLLDSNNPWVNPMMPSTVAEQPQPWQLNYNYPAIPQQPPQPWLPNYYNPAIQQLAPPTATEPSQPWPLNYNNPGITPLSPPQPWTLNYNNPGIAPLTPPQPWQVSYNNPGITTISLPQPWQLNNNIPGINPLLPPSIGTGQTQPSSLNFNYPSIPLLPPQSTAIESHPSQLQPSDVSGPPQPLPSPPTEQQHLNNDNHAITPPDEQHPINNDNPPSNVIVPLLEVNLKQYSELHQAAIKGDWQAAHGFFTSDEASKTARITINRGTALHVAAINGHSQFVKKLVAIMTPESVLYQDFEGRTALHYIALTGSVSAAREIVSVNHDALQTKDALGDTPIVTAAAFGRSKYVKEMLSYLCSVTLTDPPNFPLIGQTATRFIINIVALGYYEIALSLLRLYPSLATVMDQNNTNLLHQLLVDPSAFLSGSRLGFWQRCIYPFVSVDLDSTQMRLRQDDSLTEEPRWINIIWRIVLRLTPGIKQIYTEKSRNKHAMELLEVVCKTVMDLSNAEIHKFFTAQSPVHQAVAYGLVEMVELCLKYFPDLIGTRSPSNGLTLCHYAIQHRQHKLFNLTYNLLSQRMIMSHLDYGANNSLHLAAMLAPEPQLNSVSGCALQMQRELQWFKVVEKIVYPVCKLNQNNTGKTPQVVFTEQHKDLLEKGEKWMKDTANSCMVVSALIATIAFAGAFTVPGGNENDKGLPIFLRTNPFVVFAISNALALFSSTTSLLMFLSILTSRYAEDDFLVTLPRKLIGGLVSLFVAIATMMVAFGAALFIMLDDKLRWIFASAIVLTSVPVILFLRLQLPLLVQILGSTFRPGISVPAIN